MMPETTMNENCGIEPLQDYIGTSWKVLSVKPVAKSTGMKKAPNRELWLRVLASNCRHVFAARLRYGIGGALSSRLFWHVLFRADE